MNPTSATIFCGLLLALSAFCVDMMLPALSIMAEDLATAPDNVQLAIPLFLMFLGVGQLVFGIASDRFGRRATLIIGLSTFLLGTLLTIVGGTIEFVLLGRVLQGFGAGAGSVIGRAILRDLNSGVALAQAMAFATAVFSIGPVLAPFAGYGFIAFGNWRLMFATMFAIGAILLILSVLWLKETQDQDSIKPIRAAYLKQTLGHLFSDWQSRQFILIGISAYALLACKLTSIPRVFMEELEATEFAFTVYFALAAIGIVVGQYFNRMAVPRYGPITVMRGAAAIMVASSASIFLFAYSGLLSIAVLAVLIFIFNTSFLVVVANAITLVLEPNKDISGFASAVFSFCTLVGGAIVGGATVSLIDGKALNYGVVNTVIGLLLVTQLFSFARERVVLSKPECC